MAEELGFIVFVLGEKGGVVTELEYPVQHVDPTAAEKEGVQEAQKRDTRLRTRPSNGPESHPIFG